MLPRKRPQSKQAGKCGGAAHKGRAASAPPFANCCPHRKFSMLKTGILNPHVVHLLSRVRHTNTIVIADRGFPFWPTIETVDISLVDDIPKVLDVLHALQNNYVFGKAWMAQQFLDGNDQATQNAFAAALPGITIAHEPHDVFKTRVPKAIGLIRTGDTTQYANIVLESA